MLYISNYIEPNLDSQQTYLSLKSELKCNTSTGFYYSWWKKSHCYLIKNK